MVCTCSELEFSSANVLWMRLKGLFTLLTAWTELTCNKATQLHAAFTRVSVTYDLTGCSRTRTVGAQSIPKTRIPIRPFTVEFANNWSLQVWAGDEFSSVYMMWTRLKANSRRHARHNKTVLSICVASASAMWIGFPTTQNCRRQKTWSLNTFSSHRHTRHDIHRTVLSCLVRRWELSARQVRSASECVGRRRHCRCDRRTHSGRRTHLSGRLNSHRLTRHRQDRLVVSGGRCESGINDRRVRRRACGSGRTARRSTSGSDSGTSRRRHAVGSRSHARSTSPRTGQRRPPPGRTPGPPSPASRAAGRRRRSPATPRRRPAPTDPGDARWPPPPGPSELAVCAESGATSARGENVIDCWCCRRVLATPTSTHSVTASSSTTSTCCAFVVHCARSMRRCFNKTVGCPSVRLYVPSIDICLLPQPGCGQQYGSIAACWELR